MRCPSRRVQITHLVEGADALKFDWHIGIDYSGAETPTSRLSGLQIFVASAGMLPSRVNAEPDHRTWNWTRKKIAAWLISIAKTDTRFIVGFDHGFSFPLPYLKQYELFSWDEFLRDFVVHWPTDGDHDYVESLRQGNERTGEKSELRLCERWSSSAKSVFQFDVQGSVAKSSHAGIPWLLRIREELRDRVHFWPFDGWLPPEDRSVIAEVYPSIFSKRYLREDRTVDQQDAYAIARWLFESDGRDILTKYFEPPLTDQERRVAELEGWILGIN